MSRISSLQDPFLNALRREKISVAVYLVNGIKLQGFVEAFDQFSIVLRNNVNQMVYKHAVSTIVPSKPVRLVYSNYNPNHSQRYGKQNNELLEDTIGSVEKDQEENISEEDFELHQSEHIKQ